MNDFNRLLGDRYQKTDPFANNDYHQFRDFSAPSYNDPLSPESQGYFDGYGVEHPVFPGLEHEPVYLPKPVEPTEEEIKAAEEAAALKAEERALALAELAEGEELEEEEEAEEPPPKEPYMYKEYYMPGYVDETPEKEYPPHIRHFKNQLNEIGNFQKHGYEAQDFGPDTSGFGPDTSGFGPDTSGFGPDSSGFAPQNTQFAPDVSGFGNVDRNYGANYTPQSFSGNYRPAQTNYNPTQGGYRAGAALPQASAYSSPNYSGRSPANIYSGRNPENVYSGRTPYSPAGPSYQSAAPQRGVNPYGGSSYSG